MKRPWLTKLSLTALLRHLRAGDRRRSDAARETRSVHAGRRLVGARARHDAKACRSPKNCHACHDPWRGVSDARCSECHGIARTPTTSDRRAGLRRLPHRTSRRREARRDRRRRPASPATATGRAREGSESARARGDIRDHRVRRQTSRVHLAADNDTLRFNHKLHLAPAASSTRKDAAKELQCTDCHKLVEAKGKSIPRRSNLMGLPALPQADVRRSLPRCGSAARRRSRPRLRLHPADYAGNRDIVGKSAEEVRRLSTRGRLDARRRRGAQRRAGHQNEVHAMSRDHARAGKARRGEAGHSDAVAPRRRSSRTDQHRNRPCETCHESGEERARIQTKC